MVSWSYIELIKWKTLQSEDRPKHGRLSGIIFSDKYIAFRVKLDVASVFKAPDSTQSQFSNLHL